MNPTGWGRWRSLELEALVPVRRREMTRVDVGLIGAEAEENLALRYLGAAVARSGRKPRLLRFGGTRDRSSILRAVGEAPPRMLGLSLTFQAGLSDFLELIPALRREGYAGHICAGGQFATVVAVRLLELAPGLDSVVRGEGERSLVDLLRALEGGLPLGGIPGLSWRDPETGRIHENPARPAETDLDLLPRPLRTPPFARQAGLPLASMLGSRGCVQGCTYCSIQTFGRQRPGPRQRFRSVPDVVDEMADLHRRHGVRIFVFHDDNFLHATADASLARARAFRRETHRRGLRDVCLVIKIRPDVVTPEVVKNLQEAGLVRAYVGIESGNPRGLKTLGRGHFLNANHRALEVFEEAGVFACYNLLVFHPATTLADARRDVAFARTHPRCSFNVGRVEIYAGTPLERLLQRRGRLTGTEFAPYYRIDDPQAELASRILAVVFRRRSFHLEGLLNSTASFGYELACRRQAGRVPRDASLERDVEGLLEAVNQDTCDRMEDIFRIAERDHPDPREVQDEVARLAWAVSRSDRDLEARIRNLRTRIRSAGLPVEVSS